MKSKVDILEKQNSEKDKKIHEIEDRLEILSNRNTAPKKTIVNDEILLEKINESENSRPATQKTTYETYPCDVCNLELLAKKDLDKHKKTYHPVKHPCNICWLIFDTERGMRNHVRNVHQNKT